VATILVCRLKSHWQDRFRAYKVFVDDQEVGSLKNGESGQFEIALGPHTVQVGIDWKFSASYEVSGDTAETLRFRCGPNARWVFDVFKRGDNKWLFLEPDT
jgi:hypothetical protein